MLALLLIIIGLAGLLITWVCWSFKLWHITKSIHYIDLHKTEIEARETKNGCTEKD